MRTLAVVSVIVYHAEFALGSGKYLPGGFLGVDIFFVISGFLITSLLLEEIRRTGRVSVVGFYERRARRLLPALLTVMLVSLPFAWLYLRPESLVDFSWSLISSLFFGSNFYWHYSLQLYGAESGLYKPFLHTWSLAVEEQYYIVFPLLLLALYRWFAGYWRLVLVGMFLLSMVVAQWQSGADASYSFYMMPTRFWELLAGSLVACIAIPAPLGRVQRTVFAFAPGIGLLMLMWSVVFLDYSMHHPGLLTLIPVLGVTLIIAFAAPGEVVTRMLTSRPMVALGLLSYALYLWHYPVFAFGRLLEDQPDGLHKAGWIGLTLLLSIASYFLIEKPTRNRAKVSTKKLMILTAFAVSAVLVVSALWIQGQGFPSRQGPLTHLIRDAKVRPVKQGDRRCHFRVPDEANALADSCVFEDYPGRPYLILLGDSHAGSLAASVRELAVDNDVNFVQLTLASCPHIQQQGLKGICAERTRELQEYLRHFPPSTIIYSARIPLFLEGEKFNNPEGYQENNYQPVNNQELAQTKPARADSLVRSLEVWMQPGHEMVLVYPVPEQGFDVDKRLFGLKQLVGPDNIPTISTSYAVFRQRTRSSYQALDRLQGNNIYRVYPEDAFCRQETGRCIAAEPGRIFFASDNHVSPLGSDLLISDVAKLLGLSIPENFRK